MFLRAAPVFFALSIAERLSETDEIGHDDCFSKGTCARLVVVLTKDGAPSVQKVVGTEQVQIGFSHCAKREIQMDTQQNEALPRRFAYGEPARLTFTKEGFCGMLSKNCWVEAGRHYIKTIYAVKVRKDALYGAHRLKDATHPALHDPHLEALEKSSMFTTSSRNYGKLTADKLIDVFTKAAQQNRLTDDEAVRIVVDIKKKGGAVCPALGPTGNHGFSSSDHFKLMIFGSKAGCSQFEQALPPGTEKYCMSPDGKAFNGEDLRAWAVAVDLHKAQPLVRNPKRELNEGAASKNMPRNLRYARLSHNGKTPAFNFLRADPAWKSYGTVKELLTAQGYYKTNCQYVAYSPEQYLNLSGQTNKVKVMINANFYGFLDVRDMPCGNPIGPVVADGHVVQTVAGSEEIISTDPDSASFERLKASHVLVMVRKQSAFVMAPTEFEKWFKEHPGLHQDVNAITGQQVLKDGNRINLKTKLTNAGAKSFWTNKNARTVVGLQYSGPCPYEWQIPSTIQCSNMLVILQFEKRSDGATVVTFFGDSHMERKDRVPSAGATMVEVQDVLQFLMLDEAINLDGSGSSNLWTSIGDLPEKRSQPSDLIVKPDEDDDPWSLPDYHYAFRPSPIVFGFGDLSAD